MKNKILTNKKLKFWLLYNAVVFIVYFILSTVALNLFFDGGAAWPLALGIVLIWVVVFLTSFVITYMLGKYLGGFMFAVSILIAIAFMVHFMYARDMLVNYPEDVKIATFAYYFTPSYVVAFVHAIGQGIYVKFLKV